VPDLKSTLLECAREWSRRHGDDTGPAPLSRLGKRVAGDANFFERIATPGAGMNIATLEKFVAHLLDPASWQDREVPQGVRDLAHRCGVSLCAAALATGPSGEKSGGVEQGEAA